MRASRSQRTMAIAVLVALGIVVLNLALGLLYRESRRGLEAELGRRLENVVAVLAQLVDPQLVQRAAREIPTVQAAGPSDSLRTLLRDLADTTDLANIRVYDHDGVGFLEVTGFGRETSPEVLDPSSVIAALTGSTVHGEPFESGGEFLMAGYAPVRDAAGTPFAVVAVEADARFFAAISRLRVAMISSALLSAIVLVGLGLTFARLQSSLQRAEAAVQRAETLAAMGRMAAGIAHEIRNPLGIINATAARLKKRYDNPAAPDERFGYIAEEVERLNAILTGYLNFARDEPSEQRPLDLVAVVERSLRWAAPELEANAVQAALDLPASCPVSGDAQRLQQLILNLVLNAVQAMPQGGRMAIRLATHDGRACLTMDDTGPGFPPGARQRFFEPFVTTKEKGSGLGLAIARRIVEEHAGRITLGDAPHGGARVEIELPLSTVAGEPV